MADTTVTQGVENARPMHVEDAAGFFAACSDKFGELAALFRAIQKSDDQHERGQLTELGRDVAVDFENMADCWSEEIRRGGVRN